MPNRRAPSPLEALLRGKLEAFGKEISEIVSGAAKDAVSVAVDDALERIESRGEAVLTRIKGARRAARGKRRPRSW